MKNDKRKGGSEERKRGNEIRREEWYEEGLVAVGSKLGHYCSTLH